MYIIEMEWIYAQYIANGAPKVKIYEQERKKKELTLWAAFEWSYTPPKNAVVASLPIILINR